MLTPEQLAKLNQEICQSTANGNPMAKLIIAAKRANLSFKDVLEYMALRMLQDAQKSIIHTTER